MHRDKAKCALQWIHTRHQLEYIICAFKVSTLPSNAVFPAFSKQRTYMEICGVNHEVLIRRYIGYRGFFPDTLHIDSFGLPQTKCPNDHFAKSWNPLSIFHVLCLIFTSCCHTISAKSNDIDSMMIPWMFWRIEGLIGSHSAGIEVSVCCSAGCTLFHCAAFNKWSNGTSPFSIRLLSSERYLLKTKKSEPLYISYKGDLTFSFAQKLHSSLQHLYLLLNWAKPELW